MNLVAHPQGGVDGVLVSAWLIIIGVLIGMLVMQRVVIIKARREIEQHEHEFEEYEDE